MKGWGILLMITGASVAVIAFFLKISVSIPIASQAIGALNPELPGMEPGGVVNIGLMQRQMLVFASGAVLFLSGAIFTGLGIAIEQLRSARISLSTPIEDGDTLETVGRDEGFPFAAKAAIVATVAVLIILTVTGVL